MLGVAGLVLFIVALATAVLTLRSEGEAAVRRMANQTKLVAERIEGQFGDRTEPQIRRILTNADGTLRDFADGAAVAVDGSVIRIGIVHEAGETPVSPSVDTDVGPVDDGVSFPGQPALNGLSWDLAGLAVESQEYTQLVDGEMVVGVAQRVDLDHVSLLVISGRVDERVNLRGVVRSIAIPLVLAAVIAALAADLLARRLSGRLAKLEVAAAEIAQGNRGVRVDVPRMDAIGELGLAFNSMADQLDAATERERSFLMNVSHDLRTPLTTISGYAEVLEESEDTESVRIAGVLSREAARLRRLVEDIMLLARLEAHSFTTVEEQVDIGAHLQEVAQGFDRRAEALGIRLSTQINTERMVSTDADRVAQVAGNLIENALRFTPERGSVVFTVDDSERGVIMTVADSGPGVDQADIPYLFDRFFTGRRHYRPEGSGLGLSIVAQLAELLHATITTSSSPAGGLSVSVELP